MRLLLFLSAFLMATMVARGDYDNERYIILLKEGSDARDVEQLIQRMEVHASSTREEMQVGTLTELLPFVYGNMSEATAEMVVKLPNVELIEKNQVVHPSKSIDEEDIPEVTNFVTDRFNLDIIDDVNCTDGTYIPFSNGAGSDIYVVDSGINYDHVDFRYMDGSSGSRAQLGFDAIDAHYGTNTGGWDLDGHGTHCAGIAAGVDSGVAKEANLYSVRVFGQAPNYGTLAFIIAGLNSIVKMHNIRSQGSDFKGSIASLSVSAESPAVKVAANKFWELGIVAVASSAFDVADASLSTFFGRPVNIICVGSHEYDDATCVKEMSWFSNYGGCLDIMAPGHQILSASISSNTGFTRRSGTSIACPHVSGVAALMKAVDSSLTPAQIEQRIKDYSIDDIDRTNMSARVQAVFHSKRLFVSDLLVQ